VGDDTQIADGCVRAQVRKAQDNVTAVVVLFGLSPAAKDLQREQMGLAPVSVAQ
jgi:hypothetical protein